MSDNERLIMKGRLEELKEKLRRVKSRCSGILESLRINSLPMGDATALDLDAQKIEDYAREFKEAHAEGNALVEQIDELKSRLGITD